MQVHCFICVLYYAVYISRSGGELVITMLAERSSCNNITLALISTFVTCSYSTLPSSGIVQHCTLYVVHHSSSIVQHSSGIAQHSSGIVHLSSSTSNGHSFFKPQMANFTSDGTSYIHISQC